MPAAPTSIARVERDLVEQARGRARHGVTEMRARDDRKTSIRRVASRRPRRWRRPAASASAASRFHCPARRGGDRRPASRSAISVNRARRAEAKAPRSEASPRERVRPRPRRTRSETSSSRRSPQTEPSRCSTATCRGRNLGSIASACSRASSRKRVGQGECVERCQSDAGLRQADGGQPAAQDTSQNSCDAQ